MAAAGPEARAVRRTELDPVVDVIAVVGRDVFRFDLFVLNADGDANVPRTRGALGTVDEAILSSRPR